MDEVTRWALAAGTGDVAAAAALVRATQAEVWRFCAHLAGRDLADDLTQDVYLRAWRALPGFTGAASARTWLLAIARNAAADAVRTASRRRRLAASGIAARTVEPDVADTVTAAALLDGLPPEQREAFLLTQLLGLSYADAAEVCGCPVGTIRSRIARARGALADLLRAASAS